MNQYQRFALSMIEQFDAIEDLTTLPNFTIRKELLGYLVIEGMEVAQAQAIAKGFDVEVSREAYDSVDAEIMTQLVHSMAKMISKVNKAFIANGLGPIMDAQGMNLKFT